MPSQSTKQLVEITDIRENLVFLKSGSMRAILEVSSINFELRSEEEQAAILQNFQRFLNSIDFPLQIVIQSRRFDLAQYLKLVQQATDALTNELLKIQGSEYLKFIQELSELANIMSKKFYIVVPFYVSEAPSSAKGFFSQITGSFKTPKPGQVTAIPEEQFRTYKNQLLQRTELIIDGLVGLGLKARILEGDELNTLFFSLYNPGGAQQTTR